ncbi:MAG: hypothetical protein H5T96_09315, partial [Tissierellales bacterium]|nr:hypothetical protein [Tissierellales bacterium]
MSIIRYTKDSNIKYAYLNIFPDQFKTEAEKKKPSYIKNTMDYFSNRAYAEYIKNRDTFVKNYDLLKGILRPEDFYQEPEVKSFTETLTQDLDLPKYVKHYSIMSTPVNELIGEISKRPDTYKVKAFDEDSKAEELQFKTDLLQQFVIGQARQKIIQQAQLQGQQLSDEDVQQLTLEQIKDQLDSYTSVAEKWANRTLEAHKAGFNMKEKSEEAFKDLLTAPREFFHIYEDNSKLGFNVEVVNPKNEWHLTTPDKKYISDTTGRAQGAYVAGTVHVMELSEIIESISELTKDEIDHLRTSLEDYGLINARESNIGSNPTTPGQDSIKYDTYDPLILQTRMILESEMKENQDSLQDFLGLTSNVSSFGYKYVVVRAYWLSKKKIGKVTFEDEMGNIQSMLVDEHYKSGTIPTEISIEWGWINQWYQGLKVGPDIYHMKPFKLLDYCPIIGTVYEVKNTEAKSLVDMMKPFQVIYNICMNQMYKLLEKEIGNVASVNIRRVPRVKDGDAQDDIDIWEMEARERGIMFDDDSPENTKAPVSNQTVARNIDLTRTNEIQSRYNLAVQMKNECWELVGMSKQRLGSISASESATGTNTAVQQSYSQTEPLFVAHEYVMRQVYQAILDAAQYIESNKEVSTQSYITAEGNSAFIQVNGNDLKFRDLWVFPTNRPEDTKMFNELRMLAQPAMQNGASFYDIIELWSTNSVREIKRKFKDLRDFQMQQQQQAQQLEQQKLEQAQQIAAVQMQQQELQRKEEMINQNYQNELDRINKKEIAIINASKSEREAAPVDNSADLLKINNEREKLTREHQTKLAEVQAKMVENAQKIALEREKLQVARENQKNDL